MRLPSAKIDVLMDAFAAIHSVHAEEHRGDGGTPGGVEGANGRGVWMVELVLDDRAVELGRKREREGSAC